MKGQDLRDTIKGLLFDKDGTLFDFDATWGNWAAQLIRDLAGNTKDASKIASALGVNLESATFAQGSLIIASTPAEIVTALAEHVPHLDPAKLLDQINNSASAAKQVEVAPLRSLFSKLRQTHRLGIATNDAEHAALAHLKAARIDQYFEFIAGYDSGFGGKPQPGQLLAFCEATELKPQEVAMIGDATHDLIAGQKAGMTTIGVLTGPAPKEELAPFADAVLDSIAQLPNWLGEK